MKACPPESLILEFVAGALSAGDAEGVHLHLDGCASCQRLVGELARAESLEHPPRQAGERLPLLPGARLDRYLILKQVGVGGMGGVYAAFDPELDRKVALKLLHGPELLGGSLEVQRRWLLAEAQALARLSHPHVVTVYEARVLGDQLFLALEFVDGDTLEGWLRERPRSWREVLAVFLAAGEGLRAAHEAGIVHRDFKPTNVLIRRNGRVQVTDFGLALRTEARERPLAAWEGASGSAHPRAGVTASSARGFRAGTPAYMAPEQSEGGKVDARSDQYSFCVALHEALYGQRPSLEEPSGPAPRGRRVPARIRRVLQRGLSPAPEERFPSMRELLAALAREPLAVWRIPLAAAAALGLVVVGVALGAAREEPQPCRGGERRLEEAWGAQRRQAVRQTLVSAGGRSGETAWSQVESTLNGYASAWVAHYTEACEATRVHGVQSEALLDARMLCLERRARDLQALTEQLAHVSGGAVEEAAVAAWQLPALESCAAPYAQAAMPAAGPARARADSLAQRLSEVRALRSTGQYALGLEKALAAKELLRELNHPPSRAELFLELGHLYMALFDARKAEEAMLEAAWAAEAGRYDRVAAEARVSLIFIRGDMLVQPASGASWVREAQAAVARLGKDPRLEAQLETTLGGVLTEQGQCAEGWPHIQRARALMEPERPGNAPHRISMLIALGKGQQCRGELAEARATYQQVVRLREESLGPEHPHVTIARMLEGRAAIEQRDLEGARRLFQQALDIQRHRQEPRTEMMALTLNMLALVLLELDQPQDALRTAQESLAVYLETGTQHPTRKAYAWVLLGRAEARLGHAGAARQWFEQALRALEGVDPVTVADIRQRLASLPR